MGSGLIYIIIVGMWIAYFLPRWIANHDEVSGRSVEKFATAMKAVSITAGVAKPDVSEIRRRHENQLAVRRILFGSIALFALMDVLMVAVGLISPIVLTIPLSAIALYVVHVRHQIATMREELARAIQLTEENPTNDNYSKLIARSKRASNSLIDYSEEQWTPLAERFTQSETDVHGIVILPKGSASTWQPNPIPAPLYSDASKAAPQRRIIDLTIPGAWSAAQEAAQSQGAEEIFDQVKVEEEIARLRIDRAANE